MRDRERPNTIYENLQGHTALAWYPISISVIMFSLFSTFGLAAGQVQEVLANYVTDPYDPWVGFDWLHAIVTLFAIFTFAATLRYWTARLVGVDLRGIHRLRDIGVWQRLFMGVGWFAPWFGAALSLLDAALASTGIQAEPERNSLQEILHFATAVFADPTRTPFSLLAALMAIFPVVFVALWWSPLAGVLHRMVGHWFIVRAVRGWALPGLFVALVAVFLFMPPQAVEIAREIGPIPLICISFAVITATGSYLIHYGRKNGMPAFALVAALPLLLGALGLDDNHFLRRRVVSIDVQRPTVGEALRAFEGGASEPVILVSAEGGGIRAAHFTAVTLARLADHCPRLARRVFLISGVSGSAIGAAAYRASLDAMPLQGDDCDLSANRPPGPRQRALDEMFRRDHLSPILAKQMFPELVQMFAPASAPSGMRAFIPQTDRQLALELSLEEAFARAFDSDPGQSPFAASVFAAPGGPQAPHLLIDMTEVTSGGVFVISPLDLADLRTRHVWLHDFRCLWGAVGEDEDARCNVSPDFRLSTAAASSARFPVISPAGSIRAQGEVFRFVDGGYFDNSGVETLLGVIDHVRRESRRQGVPAPPIAVLHIDSNPYRQRLPVKWRLDFDVHELQAVLATREERMRISISRLNNLFLDRTLCSLRFVQVSENRVPLRLGWILSNPAAQELEKQAALQLDGAFAAGSGPTCDSDTSVALQAAMDRYAEGAVLPPLAPP